jgi:hypothetical protein
MSLAALARVRWLVLWLVACQASDEHAQAEEVSCIVAEPNGTTCFEHTTYQPVERQMLDQTCGGTFSDDACDETNALGACHLANGSITVIYRGYQNVDGFISVCEASGGTWDPA